MKINLQNLKIIILSIIDVKPKNIINNIGGLIWFNKDFKEIKRQGVRDNLFNLDRVYPIISDKSDLGGTAKGHYFHQDLYVAQLIYKDCPKKHVDIGSRVDGFVAHVAIFREIEVLDIRPLENKVSNIKFKQMDCMNLPKEMVNYCDSISSLHAIEHFGLGRYGDSIDYYGYLKAIKNIVSMLEVKGVFYFSVPIGFQRIEFNAHRIFSVSYLISILIEDFDIESFSYIDDEGDFFENIELTKESIDSNYNCNHGCGIFVCIKK